MRPRRGGARSFDPRRVGELECRAWVTYYRREWGKLLLASVGLVRAGFGMNWPRTLWGAWLVLRGNQQWAPYPDNDPDGARRTMERFYRLVARAEGADLDTVEAARLEVDWWRAHRESQHGEGADHGAQAPQAGADASHEALVEAVARLYGFLYQRPVEDVTPAARLRADAMVVSDRWVAAGCDLASPLVTEERVLLVRSYASLLAAVHA